MRQERPPCPICGAVIIGTHDLAKHQSHVRSSRRPRLTGTPPAIASEGGRLARENARLRRELDDALTAQKRAEATLDDYIKEQG